MNAMSWHMYTTRRQVVVATVVNRAACSRCTFDETMSLIRIYELTLETGALVLCSVLLRAALGGHSSKGDFRGAQLAEMLACPQICESWLEI